MAKIIQCIDDPNPVVITITVATGAAIWRYDYVDRGTTYTGIRGDGKPQIHALGFQHELDMVSNAWSILLINQANEVMAYQITIEWFQGGQRIDEWVDSGNIPALDSHQPFDSCTFLENRPAVNPPQANPVNNPAENV